MIEILLFVGVACFMFGICMLCYWKGLREGSNQAFTECTNDIEEKVRKEILIYLFRKSLDEPKFVVKADPK